MSEPSVRFPDGLSTRGASIDDLDIVFELFRTTDLHDQGVVMTTREDIEADMADPEADLLRDNLLVFEGSQLVGYVEVPGWRADGEVHPEHRGRGIGSALIDWMEARALVRTPADTDVRVGQTKFDGCTGAIELFQRRSYEVRHTSWVLYFPPGAEIVDRHPPGVEIRAFAEPELPAIHRLIEDAFNEWPNRTPTSYASWLAHTVERSDFDPALLRVAVEGDTVVGVCHGLETPDDGWVDSVAVRRDRRGRGVAQALLARTFGDLRRRGCTRLGLSTDSRTGALDLYLRLGMEAEATYRHWSKLLRSAGD